VIVIDASVLADFLLGRPSALEAVEEALDADAQQPLHAPELIEPETLNALRRLTLAGLVDDRRATEAALDLDSVRLVRHPHPPLRARVWDLRHDVTAYDASYLALAEALDEALLLTADRGLAACSRRSIGDRRVRLVR
jgi:predicted nucleic acid-binding protein